MYEFDSWGAYPTSVLLVIRLESEEDVSADGVPHSSRARLSAKKIISTGRRPYSAQTRNDSSSAHYKYPAQYNSTNVICSPLFSKKNHGVNSRAVCATFV